MYSDKKNITNGIDECSVKNPATSSDSETKLIIVF